MSRPKRFCSVNDCNEPCYGHGYCTKHYTRWRRHGSPVSGSTMQGEPELFLLQALSFVGDDCLAWPFARTGFGYGKINQGGKFKDVHRLVCEHVNGPSPTSSHQAAHSCGNGHLGCVSAKHLRWATPVENASDKNKHGTARTRRHPHGPSLS